MTTVTRVERGRTATLEHTFLVGETPTNSSTAVTYTVVDANGTAVTSGTASTGGTGRYTFTLPAQSLLAHLTVTWSATIAGQPVVESDLVEVVGGFYFTLVEARASEPTFVDTAKYPSADLEVSRLEVEVECERICQRAFVPRYRRVVLDGTGTPDLVLPDGGDELVAGIVLRGVRTVRSAKVAPRAGQPYVALTAGQLAALAITADGTLTRTDGGVWTEGRSNVVLEYEFGSDAPPADLKRMSLVRLRSRANIHRSGVPDRAISFTVAEGGTYRLSTPSAERTGIPEVDGTYARYSRGGDGGSGASGGGAPASRTLNFDPQYNSLFHGGRR
jgi:hypothetical protein